MSILGKRSYRRRQLLVNPPLQFRFVSTMLLLLCILTAATLLGIYISLWGTLRSFGLLDYPVTVSLFATVGVIVALEILLLIPIAAWAAILITHKVVGPLVRILAALSQMSKGNFDVHLTLRKGDALIELAEAINKLSAYLKSNNR